MSTTTTVTLSPFLILRLRGASILLKTPDGIWECVTRRELQVARYTEEHWVEKFKRIYGLEDSEVADVLKENDDEARFKYVDLKSKSVMGVGLCRLEMDRELDVVHFDWDNVEGTMELQVVDYVEGNKCTVEHTAYTSLLLHFEPVVFECETVGLKRQMSGV